MKEKIFIEPRGSIRHSSFYIKGLYDVFGKENVSFSAKYFKDLERKKDPYSFDQYMPFVVVNSENSVTKFIIDFGDPPLIAECAFKWCDKYAKVNFNLNKTEKHYLDKIIPIPTGFGIKFWNFFEIVYYSFSNYILIRFKSSPLVNLKVYLNDYFKQLKRATIEDYLKSSTLVKSVSNKKPYVFHVSSLWAHKNCVDETNIFRKAFMEACQTSNCDFEGGFHLLQKGHPQIDEFKNFLLEKRYSNDEYIKKTKLSAIVFNTPSVHNNHGWKLGEYLAMGKAIISTPLSNNLPEELVHGKNIHFISNVNDMKVEIDFMLENSNYRTTLENGAKEYYSKFVNPQKLIEKILQSVRK